MNDGKENSQTGTKRTMLPAWVWIVFGLMAGAVAGLVAGNLAAGFGVGAALGITFAYARDRRGKR